MLKQEIKEEINRVLEHFSDESLKELLLFLKELDTKYSNNLYDPEVLKKILTEDRELLEKLAQ